MTSAYFIDTSCHNRPTDIDLPEDVVVFDVSCQKIDDRRNRDYHLRVNLTFRIGVTEYSWGADLPWVDSKELQRRIQAALDDVVMDLTGEVFDRLERVKVRRADTFSGFRLSEKEDGDTAYSYIGVELFFYSDKPSKVLDIHQCLKILDGTKLVSVEIEAALQRANTAFADKLRRQALANAATHIARHFASRIEEDAKKRCNYKARLAGLNAEYAVHIEELTSESGLDTLSQEILEANPEIDYDAVKVAFEHLDKYLARKSGLPSPFGRKGSTKNISPEDVK